MSIIGWIILGLIAGWVASKIVGGTGQGFFLDLALGIVGALVGGFPLLRDFWWRGRIRCQYREHHRGNRINHSVARLSRAYRPSHCDAGVSNSSRPGGIVDRKLLGAEQEFFCGLWSKPWSSAVSSDTQNPEGA